ncbi:MAG TPA: DNA-directed RNA polymerase subunit omega [Pyrinomonadaceae bacterium]|jgi:DNA-directed RNA polymerase subunit omega|nr:DNA-directed RNA polymerase subunit omega [Pyrinomonadaceae bacterium]
MTRTDQATHNGFSHISNEEVWPGIDSRYRLIVVAALRSKQLQRGSQPRIGVDSQRRKHTSIALEEVKQGLVPFTTIVEAPKDNANHGARQETLVLADG